MRIWNRLAGEPWAITETALQTILRLPPAKMKARRRWPPNRSGICKIPIACHRTRGCGDHSRDRAAFPLCQSYSLRSAAHQAMN
jgi:hypothetical protein